MKQDGIEDRDGEQELVEQRERFQLLVEGVKEYAILMLDPDGRIVSWNGGAERIKGYAAAEVLGRHFSLFYTPEAIEEGHPQEELRIARAEGRQSPSASLRRSLWVMRILPSALPLWRWRSSGSAVRLPEIVSWLMSRPLMILGQVGSPC